MILTPVVLLMKIKITKILLLFFILTFFLIIPISKANPVPVEPICSGQLSPLNETPLYLKSEEIYANISDDVVERAEYILQNSGNSAVNISIALPFSLWSGDLFQNLPEKISLLINGNEKDYQWIIFNYTNIRGYNTSCLAIVFNFTVGPFEEKIIVVNYSWHFSATNGLRIYHYTTETARFWNRSVGYAHFNYRLDMSIGKISLSGLENYSTHIESNYLIIDKEFYNWTPTQNIVISFDLGYIPPFPNIGFLFGLIFVMSLIIIIILIVNVMKKNRRQYKSRKLLNLNLGEETNK